MKLISCITLLAVVYSFPGVSQPLPAEYRYDALGNMAADDNKGITTVHYNIFNLPDTIVFQDGRKIIYTYSASGQKLRQSLIAANGLVLRKRDYINGMTFQNDTLREIQHGEGRVVPILPGNNASAWDYQYHVTDHLGNVRMTLTSMVDAMEYNATMENEQATEQTAFFKGTEAVKVPFQLANHTAGGRNVARLLSQTKDGLSFNLAVKSGDIIDLQTYAYYEGINTQQAAQQPLTIILPMIVNPLGSSTTLLSEGLRLVQGAGPATGLMGTKPAKITVPHAHLNYQLFNTSFQLVDAGFKAVTENGHYAQELLNIDRLVVKQSGYLYVYLSNMTAENIPVYFDDLKITQLRSPVVQEDSYDPFGLALTEQHDARFGEQPNKHLFNGKELQDENDLQWYDYGARLYDAALGRWHVIDRMAEKYTWCSPYQYALNNPVKYVDPDGDDVVLYKSGNDDERYKKIANAIAFLKQTKEGAAILSRAEKNKDITVYVAGISTIHKGAQGGITTGVYEVGKKFKQELKNNGAVKIDEFDGNSSDEFKLFNGIDLTNDVKKNKDVYFVLIDVDQFDDLGIANLASHEIEAHVNLDRETKEVVKANGKVDVQIDGKSYELDHADVEHLMYGSDGVDFPGGTAHIINKGKSADKVNRELINLRWQAVLPWVTFGSLLVDALRSGTLDLVK